MTTAISLTRIERETVIIDIKGTAPLLVNAWSEKARKQMLDTQQGVKRVKVIRNPEQDYKDSLYRFNDDSYGFPTLGFKSATVTGSARMFGKTVRMTEMRIALSFITDGIGTRGEMLTKIQGEPEMREDMVRTSVGTADLRYRAEFRDWSAQLRIAYVPHMIDLSSIVALVDAGGSNGVGEWRPEKDGVNGTYEVIGL